MMSIANGRHLCHAGDNPHRNGEAPGRRPSAPLNRLREGSVFAMDRDYHDAPTYSTAPRNLQAEDLTAALERAERAAEHDREWIAASPDAATRAMRVNYAAQAAVIRARALSGAGGVAGC